MSYIEMSSTFKNKSVCDMTDREIAFYLLAEYCGLAIAYREKYPPRIPEIAYDYLFKGCKSRGDYEYLVNTLVKNNNFRRELLKWVGSLEVIHYIGVQNAVNK